MASDKTTLDGLRIDRSSGAAGGSRRWIWIAAVLILLLAAGAFAWLRRPASAEVKTAVAREKTGAAAGAVLNASGYVTARRQATVSSKITGKVKDVLVEEGMVIKEGQVLAHLDDVTATKQLALAESQLEAQRRALAETEVRIKEAELNRQRQRRLRQEGVGTQFDLDSADANADSLKARLEQARQEVTVAERTIALRRQDIDDAVIRAPFSGVAVSKDAQPGEMISPAAAGGGFTRTGICTLVDMKSLEIEVDVNESYINRVKPGQKAVATLDAYPDWQIPARVIMPVPTADRQKATVKVRLGFEELDPRILPDMGVKVAFLEDAPAGGGAPAKPAVTVPKAAVRKDGEHDVVLVVKDGRVERRAVGLGPAAGDDVTVLSGVSGGEQVVIEGPADLKDGAQVAVKPMQ
ncbi:MAG TPA: efflux RND transporter periplasmic adaptor subunit [Thermoanaerobaculia bacterium]|jgi:RND family efflux transporter MFP subunit|nr:efflux RND transporter periplasmic adaptor subunit [Thermoanaerobaculia bacterium]